MSLNNSEPSKLSFVPHEILQTSNSTLEKILQRESKSHASQRVVEVFKGIADVEVIKWEYVIVIKKAS